MSENTTVFWVSMSDKVQWTHWDHTYTHTHTHTNTHTHTQRHTHTHIGYTFKNRCDSLVKISNTQIKILFLFYGYNFLKSFLQSLIKETDSVEHWSLKICVEYYGEYK